MTMSALTAAAPDNCEQTEEQVNDASTTTQGGDEEDEDVKTVLNGTQTSGEEES